MSKLRVRQIWEPEAKEPFYRVYYGPEDRHFMIASNRTLNQRLQQAWNVSQGRALWDNGDGKSGSANFFPDGMERL